MNGLTRFPLSPTVPVPQPSLSPLFLSPSGDFQHLPLVPSPERLPELLSVSRWEMVPPPVRLPILLPPPPSPNPSSLSHKPDPHPTPSDLPPPPRDLPIPPPDPPFPAPPSSVSPVLQQLLVPSFSAPPPPPAVPRPPPAPFSAAGAAPSSGPLPGHSAAAPFPALPAVLLQRPQPVRRYAQAVLQQSHQPPAATHLQLHLPHAEGHRSSAPVPPPQRSYAQVASGTRGTGFVSAHARDVEAFACLPRTGINIISGSREGLPSFSFVHADLPIIANVYANALVMKFFGGRPSLEQSHKEISTWGIVHPFCIGPLTSRAFLLRFQDENDLLKVLTRPSSSLITSPYKIFRWHTECHIKEDSCMAPVWVSLPKLPLHCFLPEFLEAVANRIGRFLCLDKATATLARPSAARMCVELDLRKPPPQFIWIGLFDGFKQPVLYDKLPKFCIQCHIRGHSSVHCSKYSLDNPQSQLAGRPSSVPISTPAVRRNAIGCFAANTQVQTHPGTSASLPQSGIVPPKPTAQPSQPTAISTTPQSPSAPPPPPSGSESILASSSISSGPGAAPALNAISDVPIPPAIHPPSPGISADAPPQAQTIIAAARFQISSNQTSPATNRAQVQDPGQPPVATSLPCSVQKSPSPRHHFPAIKLVSHPRKPSVRPIAATVSPAVAPPPHNPPPPIHQSHAIIQQPPAPPLHQPPPAPPPLSRSRSKHHKSVSFMPQQSNFQANHALWDVVNRQIDQFNKACRTSNEKAPVYTYAHEEPPDPSSFSTFESDSGASVEAHSPIGSPSTIAQEDGSSFPQSYASEGEELNVEPINLQGHISDDAFYQRPKSSKRNKRHPDGPLKVQLRARKGSSSVHK